MVEVNMIDNLESVELNNSSGDDSAKQNRDPPMPQRVSSNMSSMAALPTLYVHVKPFLIERKRKLY